MRQNLMSFPFLIFPTVFQHFQIFRVPLQTYNIIWIDQTFRTSVIFHTTEYSQTFSFFVKFVISARSAKPSCNVWIVFLDLILRFRFANAAGAWPLALSGFNGMRQKCFCVEKRRTGRNSVLSFWLDVYKLRTTPAPFFMFGWSVLGCIEVSQSDRRFIWECFAT